MCEVSAIGGQTLGAEVDDGEHEVPEASAGRLRDGHVGEVSEHEVEGLPLSDVVTHVRDGVAHDDLGVEALAIYITFPFKSYLNLNDIKINAPDRDLLL